MTREMELRKKIEELEIVAEEAAQEKVKLLQQLVQAATKVRVRIPVNCNNGDCGTCEVKMNGRRVRACQTKLPDLLWRQALANQGRNKNTRRCPGTIRCQHCWTKTSA